DLPRDLLDLASREVRGVLGDALLKSSGGHGLPPRLPPSAYQRAVVPRPFFRGDGLNIGQRGGWRQAGEAKNFDRYRSVTLRRQEKPPDLHECRSGGLGSLRRSGGDAVEHL